MSFDKESLDVLSTALDSLARGFQDLPEYQTMGLDARAASVLEDVAVRLTDNYPYHHPLYAGQMLKPPHPLARTAYQLAMWINPNNHALDGGRASSAMEKEAVADLAVMMGWEQHLGHLCGGGSMANLEALWVASLETPGKTIVASQQAHYTHSRISEVLKLPFEPIDVDAQGRMSMTSLRKALETGSVGTVVATLGTTGLGAVDPLDEIIALRETFDFRIHVDAAYGGYFRLIENLNGPSRAAFAQTPNVDSIVIDPHKHGLQPYGCGCVLFHDPAVGRHYRHDSPYTYFSSDALHLGEITLECSRAGAAAVALWATHRLLPPERGGEFAADLDRCRAAALDLYNFLEAHPGYLTLMEPDLDIVVWAPHAASASAISSAAERCFAAAETHNLHLALFSLPAAIAEAHWGDRVSYDTDTVTCLRSTLMKPDHLSWQHEIQQILDRIA